MKLWQSVSTRLTLTLLFVTLGSLIGLSVIVDRALMQFFVRDAQMLLRQQASTLAQQSHTDWQNSTFVSQLANLTSQQTKVQVIIFNQSGTIRVASRGVADADPAELPSGIVSPALTVGERQEGQFWVATDARYPRWLYSATPVRDGRNQVVGAVYVAMPLRRPKQFAEQVKGLVMGTAIVAATIAALTGLLLSRTVTKPLQVLHRQARQLESGDYTARSGLTGNDELAQLGRLLNQMADKLMQTLTALQAQELARRELVANVSHDLRTPLATLRLELEAVIDGVVVGDKAQNYLQRACSEIDYLSRQVEQLLLLAKADAGQLQIHPQAVSVAAIAQECISRMQPVAIQAGLELELVVNSPATIQADPELTGQILLNLLDNAIKYAANTKIVYLKVLSPVQKDQHDYVPLQVQDHGQGMEADTLQRVTERFYRGNQARPRGGFGLGLAIAHQVCRIQSGDLQIESVLGQGTTVTLFLPLLRSGRKDVK